MRMIYHLSITASNPGPVVRLRRPVLASSWKSDQPSSCLLSGVHRDFVASLPNWKQGDTTYTPERNLSALRYHGDRRGRDLRTPRRSLVPQTFEAISNPLLR